MRYFTASDIPNTVKIGITGLLSNITTKDHSHKGGWTKLLKCQLQKEGYRTTILEKGMALSDFDVIIFDQGAEFSGGFNLFGGLDKKVYDRLVELYLFNGKTFSWQTALPDLMPLDKRRSNKSTCSEFLNSDEDFIPALCASLSECEVFDHVAKKSKLIVGDSHTPSIWTPEYMVERLDGRTLFGSLKEDLFKDELDNLDFALQELVVYVGNIDIRHHLMRQPNPWDAVIALAESYIVKLTELSDRTAISVVAALPIENESRKLPKTGYYKGTAFAGKWNERSALVEIFNKIMKEHCLKSGWQFIEFPTNFKNEIGELTFDVMERPKSVHISPMHYRWNLDKNELRWSA